LTENTPDEKLVKMANIGDDAALDAIMQRYKGIVKIIGRHYFIMGADGEDVAQEGMIGLYKAIREFDENQAAFRTFAEICIKRQILTAIKTAARKKHAPLNDYISIHGDNNDADDGSLNFEADMLNPERIIINREGKVEIEEQLGRALSSLERGVLRHFLQGGSYAQIAEANGCNEKAVDNALSRIRKKVILILA